MKILNRRPLYEPLFPQHFATFQIINKPGAVSRLPAEILGLIFRAALDEDTESFRWWTEPDILQQCFQGIRP